MLRLNAKQMRSLSDASLEVYLRLEEMAEGRQEIRVTSEQLERSTRSLYRAFPELRKYNFKITRIRNENLYHIIFPELIFADDLVKELKEYEAGRDYKITRDMITSLRRIYPSLDATRFCATIRTALISAHTGDVKQHKLMTWLDTGLQRAADQNNINQQSNQSNTQETEDKDDDEWHRKLNDVLRQRPDPRVLHRKLYGRDWP